MNRMFGVVHDNSFLSLNNLKNDKLHKFSSIYSEQKTWRDINYLVGNLDIVGSFNKDIANNESILVIFQGNLFCKLNQITAAQQVLNSYSEKKDLSFVKKLNGSFNFLLLDREAKSIFLATDKCGSRPLFVYPNKNYFLFGSEIKLILSLIKENPQINWKAWGQYFKINFGKRIFISQKKYWDFSEITINSNSSFKKKIAEGAEVFRDAFVTLSKVLEKDKIIIALSGGLDSRSIVGGLKKYTNLQNFDTITTLHPCGPERDIVTELTRALALKNTYVDRPNSIYRDFFILKAYLTDCLVQEHLWVTPMLGIIKKYEAYIDGVAGDIIMRSTRVRPIHIEKKRDTEFLAKLFKKQFGFEYNWLRNYIDKNIYDQIEYSNEWAINEFKKIEPTDNRMVIFLMKNRVRNGISIAPNNIIGNSVKRVFQPFYNDNLVNFGLSLPHHYKFRFIYRQIVNALLPEISHINSTSDEDSKKLISYDQRIIQFDQNPRELISDYSPISQTDQKYLLKLVKSLPFPPFINKNKFLKDNERVIMLHRINTILDLVLWFNLFQRKESIESLKKMN